MRRLIVLLLAAGLLSVHHGVPMGTESPAMDHHGSTPLSMGMALLCVGVAFSAAESLRRFAARMPARRAVAHSRHAVARSATSQAMKGLGRPPPSRPGLALLCVNRR
jgi:hypothetical protein